MKKRNARAFTCIEMLVVILCAALLMVMTTVVIGAGGKGAETRSRVIMDGVKLKKVHQAFLIFAREFNGIFPRPGLFNRLPVDLGQGPQEVPGRGEEDITQNTTANLYSALIMQNYFQPGDLISPMERNPKVTVCAEYAYEKYNVVKDVYWDDEFKADLNAGSNTSYAHLVICGRRVAAEWRESNNARYAVLGNRGPQGGEPDWQSFTCGPHGHWAGNVMFNDDHVEPLTIMSPPGLFYGAGDEKKPDNIFAMETGPEGEDAILSFTRKMTKEGPELQHD